MTGFKIFDTVLLLLASFIIFSFYMAKVKLSIFNTQIIHFLTLILYCVFILLIHIQTIVIILPIV